MKQIQPMGCTKIPDKRRQEILNDKNWIGEKKMDGSRYILQIDENKEISFTSRRESVEGGMCNKVENVPHIVEEVKKLGQIILDGEIDVEGDLRKFKYVQSIMGSLPERAIQIQNEKGKLIYKVFDILVFEGESVRHISLRKRRELLKGLFKLCNFKYIKLVDQYEDKAQLFDNEVAKGNEGIMLKNLNSIYVEGKSPANVWYKMKPIYTYDGIVKGYQEGEGKYKGMVGALIVYQYADGELIQTAEVSGMTDKERIEFKERLDRGETFIIEFSTEALFEDTHKYRFPTFVRVREDKDERQCIYGKA